LQSINELTSIQKVIKVSYQSVEICKSSSSSVFD